MTEKPKITKQLPFKFWYPHLLKALHDLGGEAKARDAVQKTLDFFDINNEIREELFSDKSGAKVPKVEHNIHWARCNLFFADYIAKSPYGIWKITNKAKDKDTLALILAEHEKIKEALINEEEIETILKNKDNVRFINQVSKEIKNRGSDEKQDKNKNIATVEALKIVKQHHEEKEQFEKELRVITNIDPNAFERLCRKVFEELGYEDSELTPEKRDGGYDGAGYWKFGLTRIKVAFEAKRYESTKVPEGDIKKFVTAMRYNAKAQKGVFFTTADFTRDALKFADEHLPGDMTLINGKKLIELLRKNKIGYDEKSVMSEKFFKEI